MNGSVPTFGQREGRVEICYDNAYHAICDDLWNLNDAQVVCRQLNVEGDSKFGSNYIENDSADIDILLRPFPCSWS